MIRAAINVISGYESPGRSSDSVSVGGARGVCECSRLCPCREEVQASRGDIANS